jgi:hypothetical protein
MTQEKVGPQQDVWQDACLRVSTWPAPVKFDSFPGEALVVKCFPRFGKRNEQWRNTTWVTLPNRIPNPCRLLLSSR